METKKRPDRAEKLQSKTVLQETVVKCSLKKSLLGVDKQKIIDSINERMKLCSFRTYWASVGINLLIRENVDQYDDLTKVEFPEFWDQTFIRQMMLGTDDALKKIPCIMDLHKRHPQLLKRCKRHLGDRNIYSFAAIKLSTNIKNHLRVNFDRTLKKYLYNVSGLNEEEVLNVLIDILGFKTRKINELKKERVTEVNKQIHILRKLLGLEKGKSVSKLWMKINDNLPKILKLFIMTNKGLEATNKKLINILPICRIKSHFITIDSSSMLGILEELEMIKNKKSLLNEELWKSIIDIDRIRGKDKTFTGTIDTDGVVVNVHFQKPKVVVQNTKTNVENKRVIGVDPGRTNIFTMAEIDRATGLIKSYRLTRNQYYSKSGMLKARKQTQKWNLKIKDDLERMSKNSPKSVEVSKFLKYIKIVDKVQKRIWKEYFNKRWRRQRFRLYGGKKRTFAKFLNTLGRPNEIVLAFGNAKFAPGGKNEVSVPTSRAFKECHSRFKIEVIDEFRTSKINYKDDQVLDLVATRSSNDKVIQVRGLLWCRSSGNTNQSKGKFVDRDVNAALNIRRCIEDRPLILKRTKDKTPIKQKIGKILRY
jgi:hypothetical protein